MVTRGRPLVSFAVFKATDCCCGLCQWNPACWVDVFYEVSVRCNVDLFNVRFFCVHWRKDVVLLCVPQPTSLTGWTWLTVFSTRMLLSKSFLRFSWVEITGASNLVVAKHWTCVWIQTTILLWLKCILVVSSPLIPALDQKETVGFSVRVCCFLTWLSGQNIFSHGPCRKLIFGCKLDTAAQKNQLQLAAQIHYSALWPLMDLMSEKKLSVCSQTLTVFSGVEFPSEQSDSGISLICLIQWCFCLFSVSFTSVLAQNGIK